MTTWQLKKATKSIGQRAVQHIGIAVSKIQMQICSFGAFLAPLAVGLTGFYVGQGGFYVIM